MSSTQPISEELRSKGHAAWDSDDQVLPHGVDDSVFEIELDDAPHSIMVVSAWVASILILLTVLLADFTFIQSGTVSGSALFFPCAAVLIFFGVPRAVISVYSVLTFGLLIGLSVRMDAAAEWWHAALAIWLLGGFTLALRGQKPFVLRVTVFTIESIWSGWELFLELYRNLGKALVPPEEDGTASAVYTVGIPALVLVVGTVVFIVLSPGTAVSWDGVVTQSQQALSALNRTISEFTPLRGLVWLGIAGWMAGLLRPTSAADDETPYVIDRDDDDEHAFFDPFFAVYRNTLLVSVLLLGGYLAIPAQHSWQHAEAVQSPVFLMQNLLLLTAGLLGFASALVGFTFSGCTLADVRVALLKRLGYLFLTINLAVAGLMFCRLVTASATMEPFREGLETNSLLGTLLALVSTAGCFVLLMVQIRRQHKMVWLLRRLAWVAATAVYIYGVVPHQRLLAAVTEFRTLVG
ncbi:MAG: hypothetical protein Fues2KO_46570 [Fuerstiella sp.]